MQVPAQTEESEEVFQACLTFLAPLMSAPTLSSVSELQKLDWIASCSLLLCVARKGACHTFLSILLAQLAQVLPETKCLRRNRFQAVYSL